MALRGNEQCSANRQKVAAGHTHCQCGRAGKGTATLLPGEGVIDAAARS